MINSISNELASLYNACLRPYPLYIRLLFLIIAIGLLVLSVDRALGKGPGSDFYVFWLAGKQFLNGEPLYQWNDQPRDFLYPPFSALLFTVFGALQFQVAAVTQGVLNWLLWFATIALSGLLVQKTDLTGSFRPWMLLLAFLLTFPFYLGNLNLLQINAFLLLLVLMSFYSYLLNRDDWAGGFLAGAIILKVTPIIFLAWALIRGRLRFFLYSLAFLGLFTTLPLALRGFETGIQDLKLFIATLQGQVPDPAANKGFTNNKSLIGMLLNYHNLWHAFPPFIISCMPYLLGGAYLLFLTWFRWKNHPFTLLEWGGTFLTILLLSAVTRTAHLVPLSFVFLTLLFYGHQQGHKAAIVIICLIGALYVLSGRDVLGEQLYEFMVQQVNLFTLGILSLLGITFILIFNQKKAN